MALIEFRNVRKVFGPKVVYEDLNLDVHAGESLTIIGGSGMGKSVMLKMLIGLLRADGGTITFDGQRIDDKSEREFPAIRRRIGMLFQGAALFDSMSVYDNVAYGLREHERLPENEIEERVAKALEDVGLPGTQRSMPSSLSGGQRKRVGLARASAIRPQVLLYDEPTTGLDPINTERINQLIVETKKLLNVTSIVVTHDMESAFEVSDRIAMIHKGFVVWSGTVDEARATDNPQVRDFIMGHAPETDDAATLLRYGG
ncbi:ABC transporter ATP-binding protein [Sandaracinus amylolyticus]|uniref:ABC transporter ATP-binding protein n=1 Tax=Sandaracinus amylolyticus TaxID=927083 RepID=UPI001F195E4B|nr:ABC transporter ATP-binding protein [Sandaracinus amylolyticus]UJR81768.1 ABC-type transport system ATP binding component [Sandaracinus amylolyticus]